MSAWAEQVLIEGYASLFGAPDLVGDVVRPGAFARSLKGTPPPMLLQHVAGRLAGRWTSLREDGRGLAVRGLVDGSSRSGAAALRLIRERGLDGLSIGFVAEDWSPRVAGGRELKQLRLREISLVAQPMLPGARFAVIGPVRTELMAA